MPSRQARPLIFTPRWNSVFMDFDFDNDPPDWAVDDTQPVRESEVDLENIEGIDQYALLCYLRANLGLWNKCYPILRAEYFDGRHRKAFEAIEVFANRYRKMPSALYVAKMAKLQLVVPEDAHDPKMMESVAVDCESFCRRKATEQFLIEVSENLDQVKSRSFVAEMTKKIEKISSISVKVHLGYELGQDMLDIIESGAKFDHQPTGFQFIDEIIGGVTVPSYNIVSAPSGKGKSIFLQNIAINYAEMGHNVVYISLELSEYLVLKRMAAMLAGISIKEVYKNKDAVREALNRPDMGKIQIKRFPMTGTTPATLSAYLRELEDETGEEWRHVVIDYPDLLYPDQQVPFDNIHVRDKFVSTALYDWAHEEGAPKIIWGASQQTKDTEVDSKKAGTSQLAGGADKVRVADVILSARRTEEDMLRHIVWYHVVKGRNGGDDAKIPLYWDPETLRLSCPPDLRKLFEQQNKAFLLKKNGLTNRDTMATSSVSKSNIPSARPGELAEKLLRRKR
ncbi:MAG: hypothetical protein D6698_07625 [Gammaproteobacteria bacterium]|nr:MAG: hypothetical protein D6698_07625 [Gammaproteobacteria bacterium]